MNIETSSAVKLFFPNPSLVQVYFEALANSLDAGATDVSVKIEIDGFTAASTLKITITDNGTGFDEESWERFYTIMNPRDTFHKGVGRLVYLRYFDRVHYDSVHSNGAMHRTFLFEHEFEGACDNRPLESARPNRTKLIFTSFNGAKIKSYDDLRPGALKPRIIEQFLPTLYDRHRRGVDFRISLSLETVESKEQKDFTSTEEVITADDLPKFTSVMINATSLDAYRGDVEMLYSVRPGMGQRAQVVIAASIDGRTIPINLLAPGAIPAGYSVTCLFVSDLFDGSADHSRQKLVLPETVKEHELFQVLQRELGSMLSQEVKQIETKNVETKTQFERRFPHLSGLFDDSSVGLIDRDQALEIAQKRFFEAQKEVLQSDELDDETYAKSLELSSRSLTEYVLYREKIIGRMKEMTPDNSEADIHNLIAPRWERFHENGFINDIYRNNAWLLDDKFMSFRTILSEGQMDDVIEAITLQESPIKDEGRPDITMIFSADPAEAPAVDVVVVELKKITDEEKDNQFVINQLLSRARKLAAHCPNIQHIWYYAIIHINLEMEQVLLQYEFVPLFSKGRVFYREFPTRRPNGETVLTPTFVMSLDAVVADAQCRNHTFLEILRAGMRQLDKTPTAESRPSKAAAPAAGNTVPFATSLEN
ncbi:ATP-binding protein [Luteolibacter soli]|uniref:ATP-binding protein n=1 Tax=Luteolibacter soli TaxID=3135280 RepID=A0ABU9AXF8_9BACT